MVIEMDFNTWVVQTFLQTINAALLTGINHNKEGDRPDVNMPDLFKVIKVADFLGKKIAQSPLLRTGKDQSGIGIYFLRSHHRGEAVKISIYVGGYDFHRKEYSRLG